MGTITLLKSKLQLYQIILYQLKFIFFLPFIYICTLGIVGIT